MVINKLSSVKELREWRPYDHKELTFYFLLLSTVRGELLAISRRRRKSLGNEEDASLLRKSCSAFSSDPSSTTKRITVFKTQKHRVKN